MFLDLNLDQDPGPKMNAYPCEFLLKIKQTAERYLHHPAWKYEIFEWKLLEWLKGWPVTLREEVEEGRVLPRGKMEDSRAGDRLICWSRPSLKVTN